MLATHAQRGDTLIEVILAVSVFGLLAVGVISIMNQASNTAQRALEITLVRQQIDAQVEALRASHQAYSRLVNDDERSASQWVSGVKSKVGTSTGTTNACPTADDLNKVFAMDPLSATVIEGSSIKAIDDADAPVFASVREGTVYGIWIDSASKPASTPGFAAAFDFRVRACWFGAGTSTPMQLETTVRLYDVSN